MVLSIAVALPSGVIQAVMKDSKWDYALRVIAIGGVAMPAFVVGTLMLLITVHFFGWIPPCSTARSGTIQW